MENAWLPALGVRLLKMRRKKEGETDRQTVRWGHRHHRGWEVTVTDGSSR